MSVAVIVCEGAVLSVTLKVFVPADNAPLAGRVALESLDVIPTVWVLLTRFQFASTALAVTVKAVPVVRAVAVPVLPGAVPGAAVSPGIKSWSFAKAAGLTAMLGVVVAVWLLSVRLRVIAVALLCV